MTGVITILDISITETSWNKFNMQLVPINIRGLIIEFSSTDH